jgi:leucyl/phenylalanyl-tRNA--protein transferase
MAMARPGPRGPRRLGPARWQFPNPAGADADGIVGLGADLEPETLVHAYRHGIFPWPHQGVPTPWFSPDPRGVLDPCQLHLSRSLRQRLRRSEWTSTLDADFDQVVKACADRGGQGPGHARAQTPSKGPTQVVDQDTWITPEMRTAFWRLHQLGWAHSVEIWERGHLVGGLYGVQLGAVFTGESMFHRATDASKVALVDLASRFSEAGGRLIDVQICTPHLVSMGAHELPRQRFLALLAGAREAEVHMRAERLPVARLAQLRSST